MKMRSFLPLLALIFMAAAGKPPLSIRFHTTADAREGEPFVMSIKVPNAPGEVTIHKVPEISEQDVTAVYPFGAPDGTLGCAFKLDTHGSIGLDTMSVEKRGSVVLAMINGRVVTAMKIDRRVSDGIITISSGLTEQEVAMLQSRFRTMGQKVPLSRKARNAFKWGGQ